jgi:predicted RNA binding protein with dsRBD fold (UPF0201 family)
VVRVTVRTPIHATEDPERVQLAVEAFWPGMECSVTNTEIVGHSSDLSDFRARVWEAKIIDTVRGALIDGADGNKVWFRLSKQAALSGKPSIPAARHALGDLDIKFEVEESDRWADGEALCWWLCPETEDGAIIGPTD